MKTTNWDFYLTGDRPESGYLRFKIGNVRLGKEESRWFDHEEATLYYDYVVDPEVITEKPKGFILSLDELALIFYENEDMYGDEKSIILESTDRENTIDITDANSVMDIVEQMNGKSYKLVLKYESTLSMENIMAHMTYWMQFKNKEKLPRNFFIEYPEDDGKLCWMKYNVKEKQLEFCMNNGRFAEYDGGLLTLMVTRDKHKWYEFEKFDYIRAISRWLSIGRLYNYVQLNPVTIEYEDGVTKAKTFKSFSSFRKCVEGMIDGKKRIAKAYVGNISRATIRQMVDENYYDTHRLFVIPVENDVFRSQYEMIPSIANRNDKYIFMDELGDMDEGKKKISEARKFAEPVLYHFTSKTNLEKIQKSGFLRCPYISDDPERMVVWLTSVPSWKKAAVDSRIFMKNRIRITVRKRDNMEWYCEWNPRAKAKIEKDPSAYDDDSFYDFKHWYVAVEPIPMSDVLRIEDLVTQEVLYEAEDAKYE